jgi:hypothetical protein
MVSLQHLKSSKRSSEKYQTDEGYTEFLFTFITVFQSFWPFTFLGQICIYFNVHFSKSALNYPFILSPVFFYCA